MALAKFQEFVVDGKGNVLVGASVNLYETGTTTEAQLYSDRAGTTTVTQPILTDGNGQAEFYVVPGIYDLKAELGGVSTTLTDYEIGAVTLIDDTVTDDARVWSSTKIDSAITVAVDAVEIFATQEADRAEAAADEAENARDAAQLAAGIYDDTTAGLAATTDGQYFSVPSAESDEFLILYRNDAGSATEIDSYPNADAVEKRVRFVADIAALRALTGMQNRQAATITEYDIDGGGGGSFFWDADNVSPDNGQTVVAADGVATGRWVAISSNADRRRAEIARAVFGDGPYIIVATGQSNAVGRLPGGTFFVDPDVKVWNIGTSEFETVDLQNVSYPLTMGDGDTMGGGDNNAPVAFCHRLHQVTGEPVYLIINADGGKSITNWSDGVFTDELKATISAALADPSAPGKSTVDAVIWLQGEQDYNDQMDYDVYGGHFQSFINQLDAEVYFDKSTTPVLTAPINETHMETLGISKDDVQRFLSDLGTRRVEKYGVTSVASVANLTTGDPSHYDGESAFELGFNRLFDSALGAWVAQPQTTQPRPPAVMVERGNSNVIAARYAAENHGAGWGFGNIAIGGIAAQQATSVGNANLIMGYQALRWTATIGARNVVLSPATSAVTGGQTFGSDNFLLGVGAGHSSNLTAIGDSNTAIGTRALGGAAESAGTLGTVATRHVAIGYEAGSKLNTDSTITGGVTLLGNQAGRLAVDGSPLTSARNVSCLGFDARASGDNQVQLGNSATTVYAYGAVQDRSDERDKADIQPISDAHIAFFMDVEWRMFRWDYRDDYVEVVDNDGSLETIVHDKDGSRKRSRLHIGAIAQQVEAAMQAHGVDFAGLQHHTVEGGSDVYTIGYQEFIGLQGEVIKRQQARIQSIESRLDSAGL